MKLAYKEYELTCIAPVHIGNGTTLKAYEYIYDANKQQVLFINETKWIAFLQEHKLMDAFADYIMQTARALSAKGNFQGQYLWDWLRHQGIRADEIRCLALRRAAASPHTVTGKQNHPNDIALQTALADGRLYIPGSTIKGALRTAVLWKCIQEQSHHFASDWQKLCGLTDRRSKRERERVSNGIEQRLLHLLDADSDKRKAVNSVMRGLRVSDAVSDTKSAIILQKIDESMHAGRLHKNEKFLPLFRECIPAGTKLHFSLTADFSMLEKVGLHSFADIWDAMRRYTQSGLSWQRNVFDHRYEYLFQEADMADMMLGGGTGFLSKTLVQALAPDLHAAKDYIARFLDANFQKKDKATRRYRPVHDHVKLDREISPRTLKVTKHGQDTWIMGLCQIHESKG